MPQEHYFSADPGSKGVKREIEFEAAGQRFKVNTLSGTFSTGGLDKGTKILLDQFQEFPKEGNVLDLGCGWGPISLTIAKSRPDTTVWALDVNPRSLEMVAENAERYGLDNLKPVVTEQIPEDVRFSAIWSNPPIRVGKTVLHGLLKTWLPRLAPGGQAMLVVQKQLGADSLLAWIQQEFPDLNARRYSTDKGFRILEVTK
jgi:16S rRNA (guanine1207-N2)-methyltransferase